MNDIAVVGGKKIRYWNLRKCGYKYMLAEKEAFQVPVYPEHDIEYVDKYGRKWVSLTSLGLLVFEYKYVWDGASGPTFDTPSTFRGALVHDGLYQLMRAGLLGIGWREKADELLRDICLLDDMWGWRARAWYKAVRAAAGPSANPGHDAVEDIEEAP